MKQIFGLGPGFQAVAPNVPKMAQNTKIVTHLTVFELGSSSLRIMFTYPGTKNSWNRFLIRALVFVLWPQTCRKWPQTQKSSPYHA